MSGRIVIACLALFLGAACVGTPLPQPPNGDPTRMRVNGDEIVGLEGAVEPGGIDLRVQWSSSPAGTGLMGPTTVPVTPGGSFRTPPILEGGTGVVWLVASLPEDDYFVLALSANATSDRVTEETGYVDSDRDGWPDPIDCGPGDPELGGRRCP